MRYTAPFAVLFALLLTATVWTADPKHEDHEPALPSKAVAVLEPTEGSKVGGTLTLVRKEDHVHLTGKVTGLTPGEHGFHIHEFGDLSSKDGSAAGGHYNPEGHKHGGPDDKEKHAGDLGNIKAGADGVANVDVKVHAKLHFILGRSIVVHAKADDFKTQPSGDAGGRVAVGVIGVANDKEVKK
jgi:Cu-Zn family superoxide dismutase